MKKLFLATPLFLFVVNSIGQQLGQVTFAGGSKFSYFSFITSQDVLIRVTDDGKITEWGTEEQSLRSTNYYSPKLRPYMGRVDYYGEEADSVFRGKIKSIGTTVLTYYNHFESPFRIGKIKSIGTTIMDYFDEFFKPVLQGKLRFMGSLQLDYYSSLEDKAIRDKLKSIGSTQIVYHSSFDDRLIVGKIKSIGPINYTWYTSFDLNRYGLKSGSYRTNINGVTYILQ